MKGVHVRETIFKEIIEKTHLNKKNSSYQKENERRELIFKIKHICKFIYES